MRVRTSVTVVEAVPFFASDAPGAAVVLETLQRGPSITVSTARGLIVHARDRCACVLQDTFFQFDDSQVSTSSTETVPLESGPSAANVDASARTRGAALASVRSSVCLLSYEKS